MTTRKIRQPIASDDDIANAFDDITWQKGAAVIRMFENWPGAAKFRAGVQQYLQKNADGNATVTQFVSAVGKDVAPAFSTYLDQAGAPVVSMELECGTGGRKSRSHRSDICRLGPKGSAAQNWRILVCVKVEADGGVHSSCESPLNS